MITLLASRALASDPSIERGKELFNSKLLGTNERSCATCHQDGRGLEKAATYDEAVLKDIVNQCIKRSLDGKAIDPASSDMKSLILYIRSFASTGKH